MKVTLEVIKKKWRDFLQTAQNNRASLLLTRVLAIHTSAHKQACL